MPTIALMSRGMARTIANSALAPKADRVSVSGHQARRRALIKFLGIVSPHTAWNGPIPARTGNFRDGMVNTFLLVECADSDITWTEPREMRLPEFLEREPSLRTRSFPPDSFAALMADGSVQTVSQKIDPFIKRALVTTGKSSRSFEIPWAPDNFASSLDKLPEKPMVLQDTSLVLHPRQKPHKPEGNIVWCVAPQLAWNLAGKEDYDFVDKVHVADLLHQQDFKEFEVGGNCQFDFTNGVLHK